MTCIFLMQDYFQMHLNLHNLSVCSTKCSWNCRKRQRRFRHMRSRSPILASVTPAVSTFPAPLPSVTPAPAMATIEDPAHHPLRLRLKLARARHQTQGADSVKILCKRPVESVQCRVLSYNTTPKNQLLRGRSPDANSPCQRE